MTSPAFAREIEALRPPPRGRAQPLGAHAARLRVRPRASSPPSSARTPRRPSVAPADVRGLPRRLPSPPLGGDGRAASSPRCGASSATWCADRRVRRRPEPRAPGAARAAPAAASARRSTTASCSSTAVPGAPPLARPRAPRGALRRRPARGGALRARRRRRRRSSAARSACSGKGGAQRVVPLPGRGARCARSLRRGGARRAPARATRSSRCAAPAPGRPARRLGPREVRRHLAAPRARRRASPATCIRTGCATATRPTCSTWAPTCARSRSCSATRASRPRRSTRRCRRSGWSRSTTGRIRARAAGAGGRP